MTLRILVNAISIKEGGAMVVLRELVRGISIARPDWKLHVISNSQLADDLGLPVSVEIHSFPKTDRSFWRTRLWYETGLLKLISNTRADVLYSHTNYLPTRRPPCKTLLLEQHAGHFSPVFQSLMLDSLSRAGKVAWRLKGHWVRSSIKRTDMLTVQTQVLARQIAEQTGINTSKISVIPHGIGQIQRRSEGPEPPRPDEILRVGYTTKYGVQKNFDVIFAAGARLKEQGRDFRIILTLCPSLRETDKVLKSAKRHGMLDKIENHGDLDARELTSVYQSLHAFVFPSLVESFGFPVVEAMANGLPILVSETQSNREVVADGGVFFPAENAAVLAEYLLRLAKDRDWHRKLTVASLRRQKQLDWDQAVQKNVGLIEKLTE